MTVRKIVRRLGLRSSRPAPQRLVVSYLYPPTAETSAYVVAKRIRNWGIPVDVISSTGDTGREPDKAAGQIAGDLARRVIQVPGGRHDLNDWSIIEDFSTGGLAAFEQLQSDGRTYRELYSRSMMPGSHILAASIKQRHPDLHWIAEFSDPVRFNTRGEHRQAPLPYSAITAPLIASAQQAGYSVDPANGMFDLVEYAVYALADTIVFTNKQQRELMLNAVADPQLRESIVRRSKIWPHPIPDAALYNAVPSSHTTSAKPVNFAYFGVFFGARSAEDLTDAFGLLTKDERTRVHLDLYVDKPRRVRKAVREQGLADVVRVRPLVPYLEFLNLTTKYDWLIVTDARTDGVHALNPYVPSKLADYRGSGRPIWALVEPGSLLSQDETIERTPIGDVAAAAQFIRSQLN
ncbi:hypothetical protein SAMN06309944_2218 [Micrococcales bacterium KH10]|nr:hypothetical protein SAMN06309944_2218 [Micrococcales bacterium KH10]